MALTYETRHTVSHVTLLASSRKCTVRHNKAGGVNKAALTCETRGSRGAPAQVQSCRWLIRKMAMVVMFIFRVTMEVRRIMSKIH